MARPRDPEKRKAILEAAIAEIAEAGLSATTAKIARRAGVAEGTLFTYFESKDELLNVLYIELKHEVYARINEEFPEQASLKQRAWHVWSISMAWAIEGPERRRAAMQLSLSDVVAPETRGGLAEERNMLDALFAELSRRRSLKGLPGDYGATLMGSMQDATMETVMKHPRQRRVLVERGFAMYWKAVG